MSKELPYFKFVATEWLTGEIMLESLEVQGLFINICALYWKKSGSLSFEEVEKRFKRRAAIETLKNRFFTVSDGMIYIKFLEEQLSEHEEVSKKNSKNAREGWEKRNAKKDATPLRNDATACDPIAKRCNKEEDKEKEEEKEKNKKEIEQRKSAFASSLALFSGKYPREMLLSFHNYWTEKNKSQTKMRFELEKTWEVAQRLSTWASRDKNNSRGAPPSKMGQTNDVFMKLLLENQNDTGKQIGHQGGNGI